MKKVTKNTKENYVTMPVFEKNMRLIANSFARIDERFLGIDGRFAKNENILELILKELRSITSTFKENRLSISDLDIHVVKHDRSIKSLDTRVDVLERKIK